MKLIRLWGVALFLTLIIGGSAFGYLLAPSIIRNNIESLGSQSLGAKLQVGEVELSLLPLSLSLNDIQVTNPDQPMQNRLVFSQIKLALDSYALLWKKLVVDDLTIKGVQFNQPRKTSGALESSLSDSQSSGADTTDLDIKNYSEQQLQQLVDKADLITLKRIEKLNSSQKSMQIHWQKALDKDQSKARVAVIKEEYQRLSKRVKASRFNLIKDRKAWKKLKRDIDQEKKLIGQLSKQFKSDKKQLSDLIADVKRGPKDDLNALLAKAGLSSAGGNLSQSFLGPQLTPWIKIISDKLTAGGDGSNKKTPVEEDFGRLKGQRIFYHDAIQYPDLLIRNLHISGQDESYKLQGKGSNWGYLPWLVGQPAKLDITNQQTKGGKISVKLSSDWKNANNMQSQLNSKVDQWQIKQLRLMQSTAGNWQIASALLNANLKASFDLNQIDLKLSASLKQAKIIAPEKLVGWQKSLATSLNQQSRLQIDLTATGDILNPKVKIRSSLDKLLAAAIGDKAKQQLEKLKGPLMQKIQAKTGDLSQYDGLLKDFDQWKTKLSGSSQQLDQIKLKL